MVGLVWEDALLSMLDLRVFVLKLSFVAVSEASGCLFH